jgi:hemoglobin
MVRKKAGLFTIGFLGTLFGATLVLAMASDSSPTLYKRLGGYDAIAAVVDDFAPRLIKDPQLGRFFQGASQDSIRRIRQHLVDFVCQATGGPCYYFGRDMKTSHAGLGITESDWQRMVEHFKVTLNKFQVPAKEQEELISLVATTKGAIVEKP